ncbi:Uncharacterised protein [Klebsiella variicola]|uniref:hypothetical protein n=1 Tax=Klebsiella variicola TaxID=244366 RepID=UPI00066621CA|nr:hypothetical protein [Klebsiella variicola]VAS57517.1 Uncharacterised protein [Klebsiella variicola]
MNIETVNELIASLESAGELSIREQKFLKLAKAYVQLAAENMSMIRLLTDISDNHVEYFSEGEGTMFAGVPLDYVSEINMYVSRDVNAENPFPATDAYLAGIKADAIDEAAVELDRVDTVASTRVIGFKLREFSQQLREGAK